MLENKLRCYLQLGLPTFFPLIGLELNNYYRLSSLEDPEILVSPPLLAEITKCVPTPSILTQALGIELKSFSLQGKLY